jgi:hypothetical protein
MYPVPKSAITVLTPAVFASREGRSFLSGILVAGLLLVTAIVVATFAFDWFSKSKEEKVRIVPQPKPSLQEGPVVALQDVGKDLKSLEESLTLSLQKLSLVEGRLQNGQRRLALVEQRLKYVPADRSQVRGIDEVRNELTMAQSRCKEDQARESSEISDLLDKIRACPQEMEETVYRELETSIDRRCQLITDFASKVFLECDARSVRLDLLEQEIGSREAEVLSQFI